MLERLLLDDDDFRVGLGPLGGVSVTLKDRGLTRKAPRECAEHLKATIDELKRLGVAVEPGSEVLNELLTDFVEAVVAPVGGGWWQVAFGKSPADRAAELLRDS